MLVLLAAQMDHAATPPACTPAAIRASAPSGWSDAAPVSSGATIAVGRAASLKLGAVGGAGFVVPPARDPAAGGTVAVVLTRAGRWRVSLDAPVWIDVVAADRRAATSVAHAHGAACSGVRKMVDFDLPAGRYLVQLSASAAQAVRVMVTPA